MEFQQSQRIGHNSNDTALETSYENKILTEAALAANFVFVDDKTARFRILPQLINGQVAPALDPNGEPEEYLDRKKKKAYSYRHMIGNWMQRCDIIRVYHNRTVTTLCTDVSGSRDGDFVKGGSPAIVITEKVKWKAREQFYRNIQGLPFDETVPKHWIRWVGLDPDQPHIIQAQTQHPDMRHFPFPGTNFMVQTLFWESDNEPLSGQKDENGNTVPAANVIFCIPKSAWKVFEMKIGKRKIQANPLTPENCHFGDFITPEGGQMLTSFKVDDTTYSVDIDYNTGVVPLKVEQIAQWWRPWEELINVMTYEDNILALGEALGESTVGYGLLGSPYEKYCPTEWLEQGKAINRSYKKDELAAMVATGLVGQQAQTPQVGQAAPATHQAGPAQQGVFQQPAAVNPQQQLPGLPQQQQPAANAPAIQLPPQQQAQPNIQLPQQTPPTSNMPGQQPAATGATPVNVTTVATAAPADRPPMESPEELKNKSENAGSDIVMPPEVASVNVDGDQMATALENFQQNQD